MGNQFLELEQNEEAVVDIGDIFPANILIRCDDATKFLLQIAIHECNRGGHCVGTHHMLIAMVRVGRTLASQALASVNVDVRRLRKAAEKLQLESFPFASVESVSPLARRCCDRAIRGYYQLPEKPDSVNVTPEDLFIAMVSEETSCAVQVLKYLNIDALQLRQFVWDRM